MPGFGGFPGEIRGGDRALKNDAALTGVGFGARFILVFLFCVPGGAFCLPELAFRLPELAFRLPELAFYGLEHVPRGVGHVRHIDPSMCRTYSGTLRTCSSTFERISACPKHRRADSPGGFEDALDRFGDARRVFGETKCDFADTRRISGETRAPGLPGKRLRRGFFLARPAAGETLLQFRMARFRAFHIGFLHEAKAFVAHLQDVAPLFLAEFPRKRESRSVFFSA